MEQHSELDTKIVLWEAALSKNLPAGELEDYFTRYISQNKKVSKEDIYRVVKQRNHACGLNFIPTSEAYKMFGQSLTLTDMVFDKQEDEEALLRSSLNGEKHFGVIKGSSTDDINHEQRDYLQKKGIDTSSIYQIDSINN
ncbi:MAG TPA: hypothetical protein IAC47_05270 [Candidatus Onthomorpha intestinigallinarum]|uniref:Uncharacterized protein n=1 Tax=Candidatus Onthomorpha intestinigallinarum TaxID=2840880 RepID=A0A9D1RG64_9BACT|nr:hypothetical protein [Candidatus Onthomorpha intestinigallinarum]